MNTIMYKARSQSDPLSPHGNLRPIRSAVFGNENEKWNGLRISAQTAACASIEWRQNVLE